MVFLASAPRVHRVLFAAVFALAIALRVIKIFYISSKKTLEVSFLGRVVEDLVISEARFADSVRDM
jgi:hypothetical protein